MKTFTQLMIGDTFYKVYTGYVYREKPNFTEIVVKGIEQDYEGKKKVLIINNRTDYYHQLDFKESFELCSANSTIKNKDGYFTTSKDEVNRLLKEAALNFIMGYESDIKEAQKGISKTREAYFEYLI